MNPAIKARSNTVPGALNGSAGHISLTLNGMRAHPSRARVDSTVSFSPKKALPLAQHTACEFLTEARAFASVEVCGVPRHSAGANRAKLPG
jgi:hypothetical protein